MKTTRQLAMTAFVLFAMRSSAFAYFLGCLTHPWRLHTFDTCVVLS